MTSEQIIEVGKALLPYLRTDLRPEELGIAAHDAAAALRRSRGLPDGLSDTQRLAIACGNGDYADDKVCPSCRGLGYVSAICTGVLRCPFCGSEGHTLLRGFRYPEGSSVKEPAINCPTCGCQGPEESWNKRA